MSDQDLCKQLVSCRTKDGFCLSKIINNHDVDYSGLSLSDISLIREELQEREDEINNEEFVAYYRTLDLVEGVYGYYYFRIEDIHEMDKIIDEKINKRDYTWKVEKVMIIPSELEHHNNNVRILK